VDSGSTDGQIGGRIVLCLKSWVYRTLAAAHFESDALNGLFLKVSEMADMADTEPTVRVAEVISW